MALGFFEIIVLVTLLVGLGLGVSLALRGGPEQGRRRRTLVLLVVAALLVALLGVGIVAGLAWSARSQRLESVALLVDDQPRAPVWTEGAPLPAQPTSLLQRGTERSELTSQTLPTTSLKLVLDSGNREGILEVVYELESRWQPSEDGGLGYLNVAHATRRAGRLDWRDALHLRWDEARQQLAVDLFVGSPSGPMQATTLFFRVSEQGLEPVDP